MERQERHKVAARVSWLTLIANVILTILKIIIGFFTGSLVVLSDGAHSASDSLSTILIILGLRIAKQPPDEKHPYGHSRAETIVAKLVALMLVLIGFNFGLTAIKTIWKGNYSTPAVSALWISFASIIIKELMYQYTHKLGKRLASPALIADAWHHRSDAISSIAALIGVFFARLGYPIFDPIMTLVVATILIKVGWDMVFTIIDELMDAQVNSEILDKLAKAVLKIDGIYSIRNLKVHKYGAEHHVDCTITVSPELDVAEGHDLSHIAEDKIKEKLNSATHIDIHVEPHLEEGDN